jgi:IclR family acetate operon transcriptional repressor
MRKQLSQGENEDPVSENKGSVGTLARGLDILELFAGESPELTQTEISERLGLPVPTVHRLVKLLTERGWLVRDPDTRRLRLGLGAARLLPAVRLPDLAREPLRTLAERTGETVNLATLDGSEVLYLLSETGSHLLTLRSHVGLRLPVHATALGKCLLAQLGDDAARAAAGREPYEALTERTITTWSKLRTNLERIRREGVAYSREEFEIGLHSLAVPVAWVETDGPVAVNVSLPAPRAGRDATAKLVEELHATAEAITGGGRPAGARRARAGAAA